MVAIRSSSTEGEQDTPAEPASQDGHGVDPEGVDADDEPSAGWGWHGSLPVASRVAGWTTVAGMFGMAFFSHGDLSETWWLVALSTVLLVAMIADELDRRRSWRR